MTTLYERIRGERPSDAHMWCDECQRWEVWGIDGKDKRLRLYDPLVACIFSWVGSKIYKVGNCFHNAAALITVVHRRVTRTIVER